MKCKVVVREWLDDVEFYFYEEQETIYVAKPIDFIFERHETGVALDPKRATFTLPYHKAIELVESLLSESRFGMFGSAQRMRKDDLLESGELKAMREHLTDMKKLVFDPPKHFAPIIISPGQQSIDLGTDFGGGRITPGRAWYSTPADLKISASRVLKAAKKCGNAAEVLKELFPEVFGPGWERFKDETD